MHRATLSVVATVAMLAGLVCQATAQAARGLHVITSTHPVVTQDGRRVHVVIRVATTQNRRRVDVTDRIPDGIRDAQAGDSSDSVHHRDSAQGTLGWLVRSLRPEHPAYIRWDAEVTGAPLAGLNVVHARSRSARGRAAQRVFFADQPKLFAHRLASHHAGVHAHRARSSSPYFVKWDTHKGATLATSSTTYNHKRKVRIDESFKPDGPRVRVHLRLENLRDDQRLKVNGYLIQRTLRTSTGERIAWLKSPHINTVLRPHGSVAANFTYKMPSGSYELTGGFKPF